MSCEAFFLINIIIDVVTL